MPVVLDYIRGYAQGLRQRIFGVPHNIPEPIEPFSAKKNRVYFSNSVATPIVGVTSWNADDKVAKDIKDVIAEGFRRIEVSTVYRNEHLIAQGIHDAIKEGLCKRKELFIVLKIWLHDIDVDQIRKKVIEILNKMNLKKVDLLMAHIGAICNTIPDATIGKVWSQFHNVYKIRLASSIGVVNWSNNQIRCALNLNLTHVHCSERELDMYYIDLDHWKFCEKRLISFTKYGTFGSPDRLNYTVTSTHNMEWMVLSVEIGQDLIQRMAEARNITPEMLLLRYALHNGFIAAPADARLLTIPSKYQVHFSFSGEELLNLERNKASEMLCISNTKTGFMEDLSPCERAAERERRAQKIVAPSSR